MLGVFAASAVIVFADRNLPHSRATKLVKESGVRLVVHVRPQTEETDAIEAIAEISRLEVDSDTGRTYATFLVDNSTDGCRLRDRLLDDAAYIFFTSGTTGTPKGVVGSHKGLSHFLNWQRTQFLVGPTDRVAQVTGLMFDVVMREMCLSLTSGATLCIPGKYLDESSAFWRWLSDTQITILHGVPSRLQAWLNEVPKHLYLDSMRWLFMVGEPLRGSLVRRWRLSSAGEMINLYGTAETGPAKLWCPASSNSTLDNGIQLLGKPLPDVKVLIVSESHKVCEEGEPGEIVFQSSYLSLGYLNQEENKGRYCRVQSDTGSVVSVYRTGDIARRLADGQIAIVGRRDDQVKIRGVRVEPEAIRSVLSAHEHVLQSFVGTLRNRKEELQLVAWVVLSDDALVQGVEIQSFLAEQLPTHFVPNHVLFVKSLPFTANGKVDRSALPEPGMQSQSLSEEPRTFIEKELSEIWCEVLGLDHVGVRDNFFQLGGHSLFALQISSRIIGRLHIPLNMAEIFWNPTIEQLALNIVERASECLPEEPGVGDDWESIQPLTVSVMVQKDFNACTDMSSPNRLHEKTTGFHCPNNPSSLFGRRYCHLVIVINERFESESFESLAHVVEELDPSIRVFVERDIPNPTQVSNSHPTLIFSPALIRQYPQGSGRVYCGYPMSKSEEYVRLEQIGIAVPKWERVNSSELPDLSGFDEFVVRKPDYGGRGLQVKMVRKERVKWSPPTESSAEDDFSSLIVQEFIYTGPRPTYFRVKTLFGKALCSVQFTASANRPQLHETQDFKSAMKQSGFSIVASGAGSEFMLSFDEEIIHFAESAAAAFPDIPLLGFDIVRDVTSGELYVLEANAIGYVWYFSLDITEQFGFPVKEQFDGIRKAAYLLAEKTQQEAC